VEATKWPWKEAVESRPGFELHLGKCQVQRDGVSKRFIGDG
jgi:hypothetical protein